MTICDVEKEIKRMMKAYGDLMIADQEWGLSVRHLEEAWMALDRLRRWIDRKVTEEAKAL